MKTYSSRILPITFSAVLVLGACGGGDDATGDVPIDSVDAQPGLRAPTPIQISNSGNAAGGALTAASAEDAASSDMMIAPVYWNSEYVVGPGMPALPTNDIGYVFDASPPVTAEQVARIASALGVVGEPVHLVQEWGNSWRVGPDDGSAPALWVSEDGQQSWNYNGAVQARDAVAVCAVSVDSDGNESSDCPEIEPPVGVPTAAEAEQRAAELLAALGEDVSSLEVESWGDEWFASATYRDRTDARAALREWNFGFGAEGVLDYASGWLAQAEPVGPYPLIDVDTAVARLNDGGYGFGGYGGLIEPGIAIAAAPPVEAAVEGSSGGSAGSTDSVVADETPMPAEPDVPMPEPVEPLPVEPTEPMPEPDVPMPVEPLPEPEPVVVTLVDVQADLWWAWDIDGSVWLLPAYRFIDADGGWHTVPAVTDEFMIQVEPDVFVGEPLPVPQPLPAPEPLPAPQPEPVDPTPAPATVLPVELEVFVGLPVADFTAEVEALGYNVRIAQQDGVDLELTADFSETRVNVAVDGEIVTAILNYG